MNQRQFAFDIAEQRDSYCGNLTARTFLDIPLTGRMDDPKPLEAAFADSESVYVVLSYQTPIAWWTERDGWVIPDDRYSPTTSRHQNIVRRVANWQASRSA